MACGPEPAAFARRHRLRLVSVADLLAFRLRQEKVIERAAAANLTSTFGRFTTVGYRGLLDVREHLALGHGEIGAPADVHVHVHQECAAADFLGALLCGRAARLQSALDAVVAGGRGVVVYLRGEHQSERFGPGHDGPPSSGSDDRRGNQRDAEAILFDLGVNGATLAVSEPTECTAADMY